MRTFAIALLSATTAAAATFAACHHDAAAPNAPMLPPDPAPAAAPPAPAADPIDPAAVSARSSDPKTFVALPTDPSVSLAPDIGTAPASAPRGEPITVTITPLVPGERRRRTEHALDLVDSRSRGEVSHQRTDTSLVFDEELLAATGLSATRVRVGVATAHESLIMDGVHRSELDLLAGTYTVGLERGSADRLEVTRGPGLVVHGREEEELASAFGEYLSGADKLVQLVAAKRLRVGDSVQLTDEERRPFTGDEPTQIWLAVVAADATSVTVQTDGQPAHERGDTIEALRITTTYARATGRMLARRAVRTLRDSWHAVATHAEVTFEVQP